MNNNYKRHIQNDKKNVVKKEEKDYSFFVIKLFIIVLILITLYNFYVQQKELKVLNDIYSDVNFELNERQKELKSVKDELKIVGTNEFVEKQAREKLKMVKPNEKVYIDTNKKII